MKLVVVNPPLSTSPRPSPASIIVLHATAGSTARSSIDLLRSQGLSYHYIIARNTTDSASTAGAAATEPTVFQLAEPRFRTAHVGSGIAMPGPAGMTANRVGVGISLANRQNGEAYMPMQLTALDEVIQLVKQITPTLTHLTTHAVIQPWNRKDPLTINGQALAAKHGLIWFQPTAAQIAAHTPPKVGKPKA
jgi:N-acetyl-anhydromuramyl-L-alanine amidase AmpD